MCTLKSSTWPFTLNRYAAKTDMQSATRIVVMTEQRHLLFILRAFCCSINMNFSWRHTFNILVAGFDITFQPFLSHQVECVCCRARLFHSTQLTWTKLFIFRFKFLWQILLCEHIIGVCHGYFTERELRCFSNSRCFPESDVNHYIKYIKHNEISKHDLFL